MTRYRSDVPLANFEIFEGAGWLPPGWYWRSLPDGKPVGPFPTEDDAARHYFRAVQRAVLKSFNRDRHKEPSR